MENLITTEDFFNSWKKACVPLQQKLKENWGNLRVRTSHFLCGSDSIIEAVARDLGMECRLEYYQLDAVLFARDEDVIHRTESGGLWLRRIRVAVEHENNFASGLFQEISHLLITECDLRVLVSYPLNAPQLEAELNYLHGAISGSSTQNDKVPSLLFIVMAEEADEFDWEGYVYSIGGWRKL